MSGQCTESQPIYTWRKWKRTNSLVPVMCQLPGWMLHVITHNLVSFLQQSCEISIPILLLLLSRFSRVQLCATPCTAAYQAPLSMGFSRQECWSRFPFPSPGDLPNPGIEPTSLASLALAGGFFTTEPPCSGWEPSNQK